MSSSNKRYIKGRAADAVSTLQEACATFERTINSSFEQSMCEQDEKDLNQSKRFKLQESPEDRIRALKVLKTYSISAISVRHPLNGRKTW